MNAAPRTSTLVNIDAVRRDYSDEAEVNEVINAVEASQADPYGSMLAALYGTNELHSEESIRRATGA